MENKEEVKLPKGMDLGHATDSPDSRDYPFEDREELAGSSDDNKRPKKKFKVWNQGNTPACTMFSGTHISNGLNIKEDERLGISRDQTNPMGLWDVFCAARGNYNSGSSIQTIAGWLKNNGYIAGYVTISKDSDQQTQVRQMKTAIDMGNFLSCGSAYGDRGTIKKTGVYSDRSDRYFVGHARCIVNYELNEDGDVKRFWAINSYGDKRGLYDGYFKLMPEDVTKCYSKLCFIDKDDSANFKNLTEIQKVKQAVLKLREVYHETKNDRIIKYLEDVQFGKNLSEILGVVI